jgi:Putative peptidoglycan binding domain
MAARRQWHMGEHQGENASTPLAVELSVSETPIGPPADRAGQDPRVIPAEAIIEGAAGDVWTLGMHIAVGLRAFSEGRVGPITASTDPALVLQDLPEPYAGLSGQMYDGRALAHDSAIDLSGIAPAEAALGDHWQSDELAYRTSFPCGDTVLRVDRHDGGDVDWWTVDAARPLTLTPAPRAHRAVPGRFRYPGAPLPRFWQIEDRHVDIGGFPPDRAHFATLLLIDLIASHSDDWFKFPFVKHAGCVLRMHEVRVVDSFGDAWPATGSSWEPMPPDEWALFRVRGLDVVPAAGALQREPTLVVWPSAATPFGGPTLEEVVLGVDEDANLMWAVEQRVNGVEQTQPPPPVRPAPSAAAEFVYRPTSAVPFHWHLYKIAAVDTDPAQPGRRRFLQGRLADLHTDGPSTLRPAPRAQLLNVSAGIHEFESATIPTTGLKLEQRYMLARGTDARPVLWLQRQRLPLLGPPSHALRFDLAEPVLTTAPRAISTDTPADGQPRPAPLLAEVPVPIGTVPPPPDDPIVGMVLLPEDETPPELTPEREPLSDPPPAPLFGTTAPPELTPDPNVVELRVVLAQALLNAAGATDAVGLPLLPDGRFGPQTTQAISSFQTTRGLTSNGLLDAPTWNALMMFTPFTTLLPVDPRPEGPPIARAVRAQSHRRRACIARDRRARCSHCRGIERISDRAVPAAHRRSRSCDVAGACHRRQHATRSAAAPRVQLLVADFRQRSVRAARACRSARSGPTDGRGRPAARRAHRLLVELRDAAGNVLYRESLHDIIGFRAESFDGSLSAPLAADPQGTFELVVPNIPRAVLLVLFGPPLQSDDRTVPSEVILTFDLTTI